MSVSKHCQFRRSPGAAGLGSHYNRRAASPSVIYATVSAGVRTTTASRMPAFDPSLPSVRVVVRGWLNSNQIVLLGDSGHAVIDSGYATWADETLRLLALPDNLGGRPLHRLINTHCHADHMGGNAALVRRYGCAVSIPVGEARAVRPWDLKAFMAEYADHAVEPFDYDDTIAPGDRFQAGGLSWEALAAPGHDMNALMYWCEAHGVLITGDALWENGSGVVFPQASLAQSMEAAFTTLDRIASLSPRWILPGHGHPFRDAAGAVARARGRLQAFAADPGKNARHAMKALFAFALLAKRQMRVSEVPAYLAAVPCYGDLNRRYIGKPMAELANDVVADLLKANVATVEEGWLRPAIAA